MKVKICGAVKTTLLVLLITVTMVVFSSCGSSGISDEILGTWKTDSGEVSYIVTPFTEFKVYDDGKVELYEYKTLAYEGTIKSHGDGYEISIENVIDDAEDIKDAVQIMVEKNEDETITVNIEAENDYIYGGPRSVTFSRE